MINIIQKRIVMFILYLILVSNVFGMMIYFYYDLKKDAYGFIYSKYNI